MNKRSAPKGYGAARAWSPEQGPFPKLEKMGHASTWRKDCCDNQLCSKAKTKP